MVQPLPERDSYSYHRDKMHADLAVAFGGRAAEELIFGHEHRTGQGRTANPPHAPKVATPAANGPQISSRPGAAAAQTSRLRSAWSFAARVRRGRS